MIHLNALKTLPGTLSTMSTHSNTEGEKLATPTMMSNMEIGMTASMDATNVATMETTTMQLMEFLPMESMAINITTTMENTTGVLMTGTTAMTVRHDHSNFKC